MKRELLTTFAALAFLASCGLDPLEGGSGIPKPERTKVREESSLFKADGENKKFTFETNDTKYLSENGFTLWAVPNVNASDDFLTVSVEAVKESGTAEAGFGVVFCERQVNGKPFMMAALINANGFYTVGKIVDGVFSHVNGGWKSFNLINRGMGVKNQIEVSFDSNSRNFVLKLNGGMATEFAAQEEIAFKGSRSGFAVVVANNEKLPSNSVKVTFENKR